MGSGHEVAKEASDIILLDDNFASIITGIRWGRTLYENIQRFLQFQLSVNVVALLCALIGPLIGVPLPFTVPQLLWINIIMDTFAALALSTDPPRKRYMTQPPVPRQAHIITKSMAFNILMNSLYQVGILIFVLLTNILDGKKELEQLTIFFTVFVMFQFWHKFNCRSLRNNESPFEQLNKNKNFIFIITIITIVQIFMVQIGGPIGELFRTMPLSLETWLKILLLTSTIIPVAWFNRQLIYRLGY
jgi:Ca2+-transporting ATPase